MGQKLSKEWKAVGRPDGELAHEPLAAAWLGDSQYGKGEL